MKQYLALARVSSREQEREGFSLEVQEEALERYAEQQGGEIGKLFRIAETATKPDERRTFRELLAYAKEHASEIAGVLFFKVDRAKGTELRDRVAKLTLEVDAHDRGRAELGEIATKAFELSQTLKDKWLRADYRAKRRLLEIVCLNFTLVDVSLVPVWRKPFDVLAEGPISEKSRAERI